MAQDASKLILLPVAKGAFDAVLLAGGKSTRMGTDKAGVLIQGQPLWRRQLAALRALGPEEIFISGRDGAAYGQEGLEIVRDLYVDRGPLGGLEAALFRTMQPFLVVLAIDLPAMRADFLARLVELAISRGRSVVPRDGESFEPLAAVYSGTICELIVERLQHGDYSLQNFIRRAVELDLALPYPLSSEEQPLFRNVNEPGDIY